jgi:SAM-dependent methyltransferase
VDDVGDREHWDDRYETIGAESVSWHQDRPAVSLELLDALGVQPDESLIDVGGGASNLVDHLLAAGHHDVGVLDLSVVALDVARTRIGDPPAVTWIVQDLLSWQPERTWDVWHDRAVLHFLLDDDDRRRYAQTMRAAVRPGGAIVIGAFAEDGPTECSALPVRRHRPEDLVALVGDCEVVVQRREVHRTPSGAQQPFNWIAARLTAPDRNPVV